VAWCRYLCNVTFFYGKLCFLVYMYYTHPSYQTSIVGKNCAYYIRILTVSIMVFSWHHMLWSLCHWFIEYCGDEVTFSFRYHSVVVSLFLSLNACLACCMLLWSKCIKRLLGLTFSCLQVIMYSAYWPHSWVNWL